MLTGVWTQHFMKHIECCNFQTITVMYKKLYISGIGMSQRIHFWYQIVLKMMISWGNGKKRLSGQIRESCISHKIYPKHVSQFLNWHTYIDCLARLFGKTKQNNNKKLLFTCFLERASYPHLNTSAPRINTIRLFNLQPVFVVSTVIRHNTKSNIENNFTA